MLPLVRQVQIATDMAKNGCARLTGDRADAVPGRRNDVRASCTRASIAASAYVEGFDAAQFDGSASRAISFQQPHRRTELRRAGLPHDFVLPNLFFHASIAYAILREAGVPLGKTDFLGDAGR